MRHLHKIASGAKDETNEVAWGKVEILLLVHLHGMGEVFHIEVVPRVVVGIRPRLSLPRHVPSDGRGCRFARQAACFFPVSRNSGSRQKERLKNKNETRIQIRKSGGTHGMPENE